MHKCNDGFWWLGNPCSLIWLVWQLESPKGRGGSVKLFSFNSFFLSSFLYLQELYLLSFFFISSSKALILPLIFIPSNFFFISYSLNFLLMVLVVIPSCFFVLFLRCFILTCIIITPWNPKVVVQVWIFLLYGKRFITLMRRIS